ncbi:hypothetical protein GCM10027020_04990 [Nocardioides salsibiostraticola]
MTTLPSLLHTRGRRLVAAAALALLTVGAVGFATGGDTPLTASSADQSSTDAGASGAEVPQPTSERPQASSDAPKAGGSLAYAADAADLDTSVARESVENDNAERKLISNGNVALQSDDVAQTQFDVVGVSDKYAGEVESKESQTDKQGEVIRSRLVLRIPTAQFIAAMDDLSTTAQLLNNNSSTADVTTEVLDKDIRIKIQRDSIDRIALLLDRAQNIRDIVSIEAQLSRRQADLATLEQKQRYLADQTAMSTVTVSIQQTPDAKKGPKEDRDTAGFFVGLADGWDALKGLATDASTAVGAVLPFALVAGVIGFPIWTVLRRRRRAVPHAG